MLFSSLFHVLALASLCLAGNVGIPRQTTDLDALLGAIPACGLQCIFENGPAIGCGAVDVECQCASKNSTAIMQPCLMKLCTYEETFQILHIQAAMCDKSRDSVTRSMAINAWITGIVPIIVIVMRFFSRSLGGKDFWWDDWLHLTSVILSIPQTASLLMCTKYGIGRHLWDLEYSNVVNIQKWTYITTLFWALQLLILKYSILCLYLRIFPNVWLKRAVYSFMAFTAAFTLPLIGLAIFQCVPVHAAWDLEAKKTAKCINFTTVMYLTVVYEVIAETVLFALPIPIVVKLQMSLAKKVQLMTFFSLGVCVIAVSIARIPFIPGVLQSSDPTYTILGTSITAYSASAVAHVCAAVPTTKNLFRFCANGFKQVTQGSSSHTKDSEANSSGRRNYKHLEKKSGGSGLSGETLTTPKKSKKDPFRISTLRGFGGDGDFMEMRPVPTATQLDWEADEERAKSEWTKRNGDQPPPVIRVNSGPELDDSASNKTMISK
ncbi:hypothetical protein DE146DRAFT_214099 [Phaeosphaeria sp. MPI-PUGE-AT-0046c]|nr:hypothetical protein DE146DRAFT_214099 [Phaeosphaeria sp. MPI-PUGE-AT-0046c]